VGKGSLFAPCPPSIRAYDHTWARIRRRSSRGEGCSGLRTDDGYRELVSALVAAGEDQDAGEQRQDREQTADEEDAGAPGEDQRCELGIRRQEMARIVEVSMALLAPLAGPAKVVIWLMASP
jgi:hypothetical protein